jgi:hypothetical protein
VLATCLTLLALGGCARHHLPPERPADPVTLAAQQWPEARRGAQNLILARSYDAADTLLRAFAARFPGTPSAAESVFWRALLRVTGGAGATAGESTRDARALLDAYIAGGPLQEHYTESVELRRILTVMDSLRASADAPRTVLVPTAPNALASRDSVIKARDEELARLRTELESTKAELDRIRRRIAPPRP